MSVRIRRSGEIVCAAMFPPEPGDRYVDDYWHYELSVVHELLITDGAHSEHGRWWWAARRRKLNV